MRRHLYLLDYPMIQKYLGTYPGLLPGAFSSVQLGDFGGPEQLLLSSESQSFKQFPGHRELADRDAGDDDNRDIFALDPIRTRRNI